MKAKAYAKLNLSLYITGARGGMHTLDSVMHSVDLGDVLTVEEADSVSVIMHGADCPEERNTAYRAAIAVRDRYGLSLRTEIEKRIPSGGGMGGSSADAAGVLYCAERLLAERGTPSDLSVIAAKIGSDVIYMMRGGCARVMGTGESIERLSPLDFTALVIDCGAVDTAECYRMFDKLGLPVSNDGEAAVRVIESGRASAFANDLYAPACRLNGRLSECGDIAAKCGLKAVMTGSGGCMFILNAPPESEECFTEHGFRCFSVHSVPNGVKIIG